MAQASLHAQMKLLIRNSGRFKCAEHVRTHCRVSKRKLWLGIPPFPSVFRRYTGLVENL